MFFGFGWLSRGAEFGVSSEIRLWRKAYWPAIVWGAMLYLPLAAGCSNGAAALKPPAIDAVAAGQQALADYDKNHDGAIDTEELAESPGLSAGLPQLDAGLPPRVTAEEITKRLKVWQAQKVALVRVLIKITLDGKPLSGAVVKLVPERFLGVHIAPATGTTDANGAVSPTGPPADANSVKYYGVNCGYYRIQVSKMNGDVESLPERYNAHTELGIEVANDLPTPTTLTLKSK
jgi:hypothetical protein